VYLIHHPLLRISVEQERAEQEQRSSGGEECTFGTDSRVVPPLYHGEFWFSKCSAQTPRNKQRSEENAFAVVIQQREEN
jgi:hypothetical protein